MFAMSAGNTVIPMNKSKTKYPTTKESLFTIADALVVIAHVMIARNVHDKIEPLEHDNAEQS